MHQVQPRNTENELINKDIWKPKELCNPNRRCERQSGTFCSRTASSWRQGDKNPAGSESRRGWRKPSPRPSTSMCSLDWLTQLSLKAQRKPQHMHSCHQHRATPLQQQQQLYARRERQRRQRERARERETVQEWKDRKEEWEERGLKEEDRENAGAWWWSAEKIWAEQREGEREREREHDGGRRTLPDRVYVVHLLGRQLKEMTAC